MMALLFCLLAATSGCGKRAPSDPGADEPLAPENSVLVQIGLRFGEPGGVTAADVDYLGPVVASVLMSGSGVTEQQMSRDGVGWSTAMRVPLAACRVVVAAFDYGQVTRQGAVELDASIGCWRRPG